MVWLQAALDKGWVGWAKQATKHHTYRVDWENRCKEGKGFYKLSDDRIATICEDMMWDNQALANRHAEEMAQLLEDFGESQEGTDCQLCEIRSEKAGEIKKTETIIVQDNDSRVRMNL